MKKILNIFVIVSLIIAPIFAFAASSTSGYYSTNHPKNLISANKAANSKYYPFTDITVYNSSSSFIYVTVPGTPIYDGLYPSNYDHIYNDNPNIYYTHLRILDESQNPYYPIFEGDVCHRAIVTVFGGYGSYVTKVNSAYCY